VRDPGEKVDTGRVGDFSVARSIRRRVAERLAARPVFVRRIGVENFGHDVIRGRAIEQARGHAAHRIALRKIGERKKISRVKQRRERLRIARRLCKAMIEAAASRARDVDVHRVKHLPPVFIGVEALVEEVTQEATAL